MSVLSVIIKDDLSVLDDGFEVVLEVGLEFQGLFCIFLLFHDDDLDGYFEEVEAGEFGVAFDPLKNIVLNVPKIEKINKKQYKKKRTKFFFSIRNP